MKMVLTNGSEFFSTSLDIDLTIDGDVYEADWGYQPSAIDQSSGLAVDNMDVVALLDSSADTRAEILAGLYDYAEIDVFMVNYRDLTMGKLYYAKGWILGEVSVQDNKVVTEVRGKAQKLSQQIVGLYSPECRATLGDTRCGVTIEPDDWAADTAAAENDVCKATSYDARRYRCTVAGTSGGTEPTWDTTIGNSTVDNTATWIAMDAYIKTGTVTGVTSKAVFIDTGRLETDDLWAYGNLTWTSGNNNGFSMEVKSFVPATDVFTLFLPMAYDIEVGDTYKVTFGCNKTDTFCKDKFDNLINMRAEIFLPGIDKLLDQKMPG